MYVVSTSPFRFRYEIMRGCDCKNSKDKDDQSLLPSTFYTHVSSSLFLLLTSNSTFIEAIITMELEKKACL